MLPNRVTAKPQLNESVNMSSTLFANARLVLDDADHLTEPRQVVVDDNLITHIGAHAPATDRVIDVGGRTALPPFARPTSVKLE
jgi:imidazolonepropionase-like amidohydrolase